MRVTLAAQRLALVASTQNTNYYRYVTIHPRIIADPAPKIVYFHVLFWDHTESLAHALARRGFCPLPRTETQTRA